MRDPEYLGDACRAAAIFVKELICLRVQRRLLICDFPD